LKTLHCSDLTKEVDSLLSEGYRLDMIMPADDPREAIVSRDGEAAVRLVTTPLREPGASEERPPEGGTQNESKNEWKIGRAGMEYRDLIPDRLGGAVVASHIRITDGGEVPDYVHYHKINFQMIYCKAGWIRVVYEDQGPPFVLEAGDCVLQPPGIRHRVLESSAGAEVIEVSSPSEHETWVEHELTLPTNEINSERLFEGQRFVLHRHRDTDARTIIDTGIEKATNGNASVRIVRLAAGANHSSERFAEFVFLYVLLGNIQVDGSNSNLRRDEHLVLTRETITALEDSEILEVSLRQL